MWVDYRGSLSTVYNDGRSQHTVRDIVIQIFLSGSLLCKVLAEEKTQAKSLFDALVQF